MDALPIAGGGLCAGAAFLAWAVRGRSSAVFGRSVWRGNGGSRKIALTFDDGPSEGTPAIVDILAQYRAPATFFQIGANVDRLPDVARAVAVAGAVRTPDATRQYLRSECDRNRPSPGNLPLLERFPSRGLEQLFFLRDHQRR